MTVDKKFNIRVYGLLLWNNHVLVTDEWIWDRAFTKFPGGGLEWGEGTADCLLREFREEFGPAIDNSPMTIGSLFYLNDFFQPSAFNSQHQVMSIYYLVSTTHPQNIAVKHKAFDFDRHAPGEIIFRWVPLTALDANDFHFPIDKVVAKRLAQSL